jgi:hypothetical protein
MPRAHGSSLRRRGAVIKAAPNKLRLSFFLLLRPRPGRPVTNSACLKPDRPSAPACTLLFTLHAHPCAPWVSSRTVCLFTCAAPPLINYRTGLQFFYGGCPNHTP